MSKAFLKLMIVLLCVLAVGLFVSDHYGVSWDEPLHIRGVQKHFRFVFYREPIYPVEVRYHGQAFDVTAEILYQLKRFFREGAAYQPYLYKGNSTEKINQFRERVTFKHRLVFLSSLIAYLSVAAMISIFCGFEYAWFGIVALALFPAFWGHSFFNQKDIPFAALFTLGTYRGAVWLNQFNEWANSRLRFRCLIFSSIAYGMLAGLCSGIRFVGFTLVFFVFVTHLFLAIKQKSIFRLLSWQGSLSYSLMFLSFFLVCLACYPSYWFNPFDLFDLIPILAKFPKSIPFLFEGRLVAPTALPWHYLPQLFILTTPIIFLIFFFIGLVFLFLQYSRMGFLQRACFILLLLHVFFIAAIAIIGKSTLYDNNRHFLFIIPAMAVISASAMVKFYQSIPLTPSRRVAHFSGLCFLGIIVWSMVNLHPYEYVYFNGLTGGLAGAYQKYETEYWGLSFRKGVEWINQQPGQDKKVIVAGPVESAAVFADPSLTFEIVPPYTFIWDFDFITSLPKAKDERPERPFYYLALTLKMFDQTFPECPEVHRVSRDGIPLSIIKKCG